MTRELSPEEMLKVIEFRIHEDPEPDGHRCGRCFGPYGKSAIPCPNEPGATR